MSAGNLRSQMGLLGMFGSAKPDAERDRRKRALGRGVGQTRPPTPTVVSPQVANPGVPTPGVDRLDERGPVYAVPQTPVGRPAAVSATPLATPAAAPAQAPLPAENAGAIADPGVQGVVERAAAQSIENQALRNQQPAQQSEAAFSRRQALEQQRGLESDLLRSGVGDPRSRLAMATREMGVGGVPESFRDDVRRQQATEREARTIPLMTNETLLDLDPEARATDTPEEHRRKVLQRALDERRLAPDLFGETAEEVIQTQQGIADDRASRRADLRRQMLVGMDQDSGALGRLKDRQDRERALRRGGGDLDQAEFLLTGERPDPEVPTGVQIANIQKQTQELKGQQGLDLQAAKGKTAESLARIDQDTTLSTEDKKTARAQIVEDLKGQYAVEIANIYANKDLTVSERNNQAKILIAEMDNAGDLAVQESRNQAPKVVGRGGSLQTPGAPSGEASLPTPQSAAERDALPPGTQYIHPSDGNVYVR